jgi:hypothetical protein
MTGHLGGSRPHDSDVTMAAAGWHAAARARNQDARMTAQVEDLTLLPRRASGSAACKT